VEQSFIRGQGCVDRHNNSEERDERHPTATERSEEDDFKDQMPPSSVEKLINHRTAAKRKHTHPISPQPTFSSLTVNPSDKKRKLASKKKTAKRRKMRFNLRKNTSQRAVIEKFWWIGADNQGDWLEVKWVGSENPTKQLAQNVPKVFQPLIAKAKAKGDGQDVSWTYCAGNGETVDPLILDGVRGEVVCEGPPQLAILHHHNTKWCPLFSLCNVMGVSKKKMKKVRKKVVNDPLGDLSHIADQAAGSLGVSLRRVQGDVDFVLRQRADKWLLHKGVHCISVDCARKLIFDSGRADKKTLHLTKVNLKLCGFHDELDDLRMVVS
jgi:hypothetical protein